MKLIPPVSAPSRPVGRRAGRSHAHHTPKPKWLTEYIENKGQYVLLSCGHKEDLTWRGLLVIARLGLSTQVMCERCNEFVNVERPMMYREYADLPPVVNSDIPLF